MKTLILSFGLLGASLAHACELKLSEPWIRAAPPTAAVLGGFVVLDNPGNEAVSITGASSAAFGRVELHSMTMDGDVMRMRKLDHIDVPAGGQVRLAPGELHLMLFEPKTALASGASADIAFTLDCGGSASAQFTVR